jgi:hypothetical protein
MRSVDYTGARTKSFGNYLGHRPIFLNGASLPDPRLEPTLPKEPPHTKEKSHGYEKEEGTQEENIEVT